VTKLTQLRGQVSVPKHIKVFAMILALIDGMYYGDRNELIRRLVVFYKVPMS